MTVGQVMFASTCDVFVVMSRFIGVNIKRSILDGGLMDDEHAQDCCEFGSFLKNGPCAQPPAPAPAILDHSIHSSVVLFIIL